MYFLRWKLSIYRREIGTKMKIFLFKTRDSESVDLWSKMKIFTFKMRITLSEMKIRVCYLRWKFHGLRWELMCWMESVDLWSKMKIFTSKMTITLSEMKIRVYYLRWKFHDLTLLDLKSYVLYIGHKKRVLIG